MTGNHAVAPRAARPKKGQAARPRRLDVGQQERWDLGRRLAEARTRAGLTQQQFSALVKYSRSAVSNAEIGHPDVARGFWARCDKVLGTGRSLTLAFDRIKAAQQQAAPEPEYETRSQAYPHARRAIQLVDGPKALVGYQELGWPVTLSKNDQAGLATGEVLDALEVPAIAGRLAASLWRYSQGRPDVVRHLPALPRPARALAVIAATDRWYFLAAAGSCPWTGPTVNPDGTDGLEDEADDGGTRLVIVWHAHGGQIPVPPSPTGTGNATWAHLPSQTPRLAPAVALTALLAMAVATTASHGYLTLTPPGGMRIIPGVSNTTTKENR
jgi:transcriptional regulator with XRE-family HTH domain